MVLSMFPSKKFNQPYIFWLKLPVHFFKKKRKKFNHFQKNYKISIQVAIAMFLLARRGTLGCENRRKANKRHPSPTLGPGKNCQT